MRLLFVADGHSPIALNWIAYFAEKGHEVHLASTFPAAPDVPLASTVRIPLTLSGLVQARPEPDEAPASPAARARAGSLVRGARGLRLRVFLRHWLGPFTVPAAAHRLRRLIDELQPDLVHALRIPLEGMLAAASRPRAPLMLSVWGNDFTLHARASPLMARGTRAALRRAAALHVDCRRDLRLAGKWGYPDERPSIVLPGNGGVRSEIFFPGRWDAADVSAPTAQALRAIPEDAPVLINPRGFRAYVRQDVFFRCLPQVLDSHPGTHVICPAMAGEEPAERWMRRLGLETVVHLLPPLIASDMAAAFRRALVSVSPSTHDGTPNTLLEAMACGCTPVAGDLESIREWINDGVNGLLTDPQSPDRLARSIIQALAAPQLRSRAAAHNRRLIAERAEYFSAMGQAEDFYRRLVGG